jgi:hypothetical protein
MNTISRGIAAIAVITASTFTITACGDEIVAPPQPNTINPPADTPSKAYPFDGREHRSQKWYPADGRENRNNHDKGIATGDHKAPVD